MTGFENRTFRDLVRIKAIELEMTEIKEGKQLAEELKEIVKKYMLFKIKTEQTINRVFYGGIDCD